MMPILQRKVMEIKTNVNLTPSERLLVIYVQYFLLTTGELVAWIVSWW